MTSPDPIFDPATALRDAWAGAAEGDDPYSRQVRNGLMAFASSSPQLSAVMADLVAPIQAELDLRLTGNGAVYGHETSASLLGRLLTRSAEAVKEIAKSIGNLSQYPTSLRTAAFAPGSVEVRLSVPPAPVTQGPLPNTDIAESLDSIALRRLTSILAQAAADDDPDSPLLANVQALRAGAQRAVGMVAATVVEGGWEISAELRQRGRETARVEVTRRAAQAIVDATDKTITERQQAHFEGVVDGQRRSLGAMWFLPDAGRPFEASVATPELLLVVARLATEPEHRVSALFNVLITYPPGDASRQRRSFELVRIDEVEGPMLLGADGVKDARRS